MPLIDENDLIQAGWLPGGQFPELLAAAARFEARGVTDKAYVLKLLARDFDKPPPKMRPRQEPVAFGEAIAATSEADEKNIAKVRLAMQQLLKTPVIQGGAIMPDACPAGAGEAVIPVGGAIAVERAILPAAHSADICCSMYASFFHCEQDTGEMLDALMASTRFGAGGRKPGEQVYHPVVEEDVWDNRFLSGLQNHAAMHIADQGDGNHFAYLGKINWSPAALKQLDVAGHSGVARALANHRGDRDNSFLALVTHHGSRGLGAHVYKRGHKAAIRETARIAENIPKAAAWLDTDTELGNDYWEALQYVSRWTKANHQAIHQRFLKHSEADLVTEFGNEHNFVWRRGENFLHGKGATPAWADGEGRPLLGLVPLNMAEPILITLGRDNEDFLSFCPHGAGRNQSRRATMREFKDRKTGQLDEQRIQHTIAQTTAGLDIRWFHGKADLTESPIGYKSATQVRDQIEHFHLADIVAEIEPLGCIMAGDSGPKPWELEKPLTPKQKRQIEHRATRRKSRQSMRRAIDDWENDEDQLEL